MDSGLFLTRGYLVIFFIVSRGYFQGSEAQSSDPCLRGFTNTLPPVNVWGKYDVLDVDGGSFVITEFTCNGTLNNVTIPYLVRLWENWESSLELTLAIWRKTVGGNYIQVGEDILLQEQITNIDASGYPPSIFRYATKETNIDIQKHDILLLIGRKYFYYSINNVSRPEIIKRHIPALLTKYQLPGSTKTLYFPMIHVNFSGQTDEVAPTMVTASLPSTTSSDSKQPISTSTNPCLRGFTNTIPPVNYWLIRGYGTLDVDGGSFVYTEFTCNGTLNNITIPYMIVRRHWQKWERNLELTLAIWRKNVRGNYVQVGKDILLKEQITNIDPWGYPSNVFRNATKQTNIDIQKHDILLLIGRKYNYNTINSVSRPKIIRRHIPALLTTYQLPGSTKTLYFPMIHVDFSGQTDEVAATEVTASLPSTTCSDNKQAMSTSTSHQCGDNSSTSLALGVLLGLLLLAVLGLLVIIAILAVKLQKMDRKYKDSIHWQTEQSCVSDTNKRPLLTVEENTGSQAEKPEYELASKSATDQ